MGIGAINALSTLGLLSADGLDFRIGNVVVIMDWTSVAVVGLLLIPLAITGGAILWLMLYRR